MCRDANMLVSDYGCVNNAPKLPKCACAINIELISQIACLLP